MPRVRRDGVAENDDSLPRQRSPESTRADQLRGEYGRYRANNDLLWYHLDIRVDPKEQSISGTNSIRFRMLEVDDQIQIDLYENLALEQVLWNDAPLEYERELNAVLVDKDELLRRADIVILILPYTRETHHFIGARELSLMKAKAVLINVARGGIVDDAALVEALRAKRIWAAGLDVYENEPRLNPALLDLTNVVLSPHIASASEPTRQAMAMTAARNCVAALTSGNPPDLLNREVVRQSA